MNTSPVMHEVAAAGAFPAAHRPAAERAVPMPARERSRRSVVRWVFIVYLLLIFEGSLRKWVVPQFSAYLFFIRDPLVIYIYFIATRNNLWPKRSLPLMVSFAMAALSVLLVVAQGLMEGVDSNRMVLAVYGWRNYFLYLPLAFLIGAQFTAPDLSKVYRWTLLLAIPIGVLVAVQFAAPINSPINVGIAEEKELQFKGLGLDAEHTRPMGPFSSGAGQGQYVTSAFAVLLGLVLLPRRTRRISVLLLVAASGGVATCLALSGSRGAIAHSGLIIMFALLVGVLGRSGALKSRALVLPLVFAGAALVAYPIVFPDAFSAFMTRWTAADKFESNTEAGGLVGRSLYGFIDFARLLNDVPVLGYGLGYGGNASTTLGIKIRGVAPGALAETDWARHIVDLGPAFGIAYIAFRIWLSVWLSVMVLRATRRHADPMPMLLLAYVGQGLLLAQITGQGAVHGYTWLFTGFCIAAAKQAGVSHRTQ